MITMIVAMDKNRGIGYKNNLLTYLPGDLPRFQKITEENSVIMGRKTFDSLPKGPLKNRTNIVVTRNKDLKIDGAIVCHSLDEAIKKAPDGTEIFIIGGGEIYNQGIDIAEKLLITQIDREFEADTYFPDLKDEWLLTDSIKNNKDPELVFSYNTYLRK